MTRNEPSILLSRVVGFSVCGLLTGLLLAAQLSANTVAQYQELVIGVGETKVIAVPPGSDIGYTGPLHVVQADAGSVKVIGDGQGWGSVTVRSSSGMTQYSVQVVAIPPEHVVTKLKTLLAGMNLNYTIVGGQVVIEGKITRSEDLERFRRVIEAFPTVINLVSVAAREVLIEIAVTLLEVDVTNASSFGLLNIAPPSANASLSGTIPIRGTGSPKVELGFAASSQLLDALSAQIRSGRAKIVANPRVVTLNRKEAIISSGGEIPYRVVSPTGAQGVEYKSYGIMLRVTPEERTNDILLQLHLESSEPVGTVSGSSENPLTSRSISLQVAVEKNKTLCLAGLHNAVTSRASQSGCLFPLLTWSSSVRRREIVVLLTPRIAPEGLSPESFPLLKSQADELGTDR